MAGSYGSTGSGVGVRSHKTRECVVDMLLKVITDDDSIELGASLGVFGWG